jgi:hypothetical protein
MKAAVSFLGARLASFALAATALLAPVTHARAALLITVPTQVVPGTPGSTGAFDLTLTNTGPGASPAIDGFTFRLDVSGASGVTFTGVTIGTTAAPYIFAGNSLFGPNIGTSAPGSSASASDLFAIFGFGTTLGPGATVGLGHVSYGIAAGAPGGVDPITIFLPQTSLSDSAFPTPNNVPFTAVNGSLTVIGVPEPATVMMMGAGLLTLVGIQRVGSQRKAVA